MRADAAHRQFVAFYVPTSPGARAIATFRASIGRKPAKIDIFPVQIKVPPGKQGCTGSFHPPRQTNWQLPRRSAQLLILLKSSPRAKSVPRNVPDFAQI